MKSLAAAKVSRAGRTARTWNHETNEVKLDGEKEALRLIFSLSSKGGGITDVQIVINPDDFGALVAAMVTADRARALREMTAAVAKEVSRQSEYDKANIRKGRASVSEAADRAFYDAPSGHDHAERLTKDMVEQIVEKLNASDDDDSEDSDED
jgi:hypothetical protein